MIRIVFVVILNLMLHNVPIMVDFLPIFIITPDFKSDSSFRSHSMIDSDPACTPEYPDVKLILLKLMIVFL